MKVQLTFAHAKPSRRKDTVIEANLQTALTMDQIRELVEAERVINRLVPGVTFKFSIADGTADVHD